MERKIILGIDEEFELRYLIPIIEDITGMKYQNTNYVTKVIDAISFDILCFVMQTKDHNLIDMLTDYVYNHNNFNKAAEFEVEQVSVNHQHFQIDTFNEEYKFVNFHNSNQENMKVFATAQCLLVSINISEVYEKHKNFIQVQYQGALREANLSLFLD